MRKSACRLFQVGVHPATRNIGAAAVRGWPEQEIPKGFNMLPEQRWQMKALPRDTGRIPRDFLLNVLFQSQPVEVDQLWDQCVAQSGCVLDSKRHLRQVLKQCRDEGYVSFEKDPIAGRWVCLLTRERYEEVRETATAKAERQLSMSAFRGNATTATAESAEAFTEVLGSLSEKENHLKKLQEQLKTTSAELRKYERTEIDYLPYTDLNGRVSFMYWYETRDGDNETMALPSAGGSNALPGATEGTALPVAEAPQEAAAEGEKAPESSA